MHRNQMTVRSQINALFLITLSPSLVTRPHPQKEGKGSGDFRQFSWFGWLWVHMPTWVHLNKVIWGPQPMAKTELMWMGMWKWSFIHRFDEKWSSEP